MFALVVNGYFKVDIVSVVSNVMFYTHSLPMYVYRVMYSVIHHLVIYGPYFLMCLPLSAVILPAGSGSARSRTT